MRLVPHSAILAAIAFVMTTFAVTASVAAAQGISEPGGSSSPDATATDRVTAAIVARELRAMGLPADVIADSGDEPRVDTTVDRFKWSIFLYGCQKEGALAERPCLSLQFFSGYSMTTPVSALTTNKFNAENRYTRTYTATTARGHAARIAMDVMFANTGADPARLFRTAFTMMKHQNAQFRKLINFN